jgi:phospholipid-translocating ATPase
LGHRVGSGIVQPELDKLEAVRKFAVPKTKWQVRTSLGLTGYYRRFVPNYAAIAAPITDLTRKAAPTTVNWSDQCQRAFQNLKDILCTAPVLRSPNFDLPFILQTDAVDRGVAAVLSQIELGVEHPIAYFSRKLLPQEQRYSTIEKECLAIKLGVHAFRVYLLGRPFSVQTDHRALEWLNRLKDTNSRLSRWSLALQPYDFQVIHRAGRANGNADALSRMYNDVSKGTWHQRRGEECRGLLYAV